MFFPKLKFLIVLLLFINACNTQRVEFSSNEKKISGEKVNIGFIIGSPFEINILDSLLFFYDRFEGQTITVFDLKNERFVRRFLNEGRGPGEVTSSLTIFVYPNEKRVCFYQPNIGIAYIFEPSDIITEYNPMPRHIIYINKDHIKPDKIKKIKDGYIGIGSFDVERYHLYDSLGNMISAFGKYPFSGEEMENGIMRYLMYQGFFCASADGNYFAMGSSNCDNLEFYRLKNGTAELIKKYETYDVKAKINKQGNSQFIHIEDDCVMSYKYAYGGRYCYMLYSGKTYLENGRYRFGGKRIIVFDWDGNYLKSYQLDDEINSFCVDEENSFIYATMHDDNDENGGGLVIKKFFMQ